jgi:hypothetical protein
MDMPHTFEHAHTFTYLGTILNKDNNKTEEVRNRIAIANIRVCYFSLQKPFKSNFLSTNAKILLNEKMVDVFERKILRRINGPVKDRDQWRCRYNQELYDLSKESRLSVIIGIARLRWSGHVTRMEENSMPRRLMYMQPEGPRKGGTPRAKWRMMWGRMQGCWE